MMAGLRLSDAMERLVECSKLKFSAAFEIQNKVAQTAIQSLDCLNDQIVQYIFTPKNADITLDKELSPKEQDTLKSSMVLIRRLLLDAQSKFRKMVEDNKQLAARIDGSIYAANQEVNALRAELADTNKRLSELGTGPSTNGLGGGGNHVILNGPLKPMTPEKDAVPLKSKSNDEENELIQLREENARLLTVIQNLNKDMEELRCKKPCPPEPSPSYGELKLELIQSRQELNRAKEALHAMKADRKRLKAEKLDLLNQMKQLYGTLEDKEAELRDFIRNYEQRMKEGDESIQQLADEKEASEREKWEIIKRARDAAERSVILRSQLDMKEQQIKSLENELSEFREEASNQSLKASFTPEMMPSPSSGGTATTPCSEDLPPYETPPPSASYKSKNSFNMPTSSPVEEKSDILPQYISLLNFSANTSAGHNEDSLDTSQENKRKKRRSFGSLSKVFSIGRTRRSIAVPTNLDLEDHDGSNLRVSLLSTHNYQEKLLIIDQSKDCPMASWKANQVLAWLEIVLSMPLYGKLCAENVKSGKVLLELSDSELGSALGITNILHRRKLRLAVEECRDPSTVKCPKASFMDHTWVAHRWVPDLGLRQYTTVFEVQLLDGRMLNTLTRKDLEKHLAIHRKFHQASILNAIELLRRVDFDKEVLSRRRGQCENKDCDPVVWTNQRVIKWVHSIDLGEYAENLVESGVNGALMTLEPSFSADIMATALGIPPSKSYVRRHLTSELDTLLKPARAALETGSGEKKKSSGGTLGRSFNRSFRGAGTDDSSSHGSRFSFRGSLGRAFGRRVKDDLKSQFDGESPSGRQKPTISGPISPPIKNSSFSSDILQDKTV